MYGLPGTPAPDAQASYAMGYNLAIEYMADYEKTWMLDSFRTLNDKVLAPQGRPLNEWVFLEVSWGTGGAGAEKGGSSNGVELATRRVNHSGAHGYVAWAWPVSCVFLFAAQLQSVRL